MSDKIDNFTKMMTNMNEKLNKLDEIENVKMCLLVQKVKTTCIPGSHGNGSCYFGHFGAILT